MWRNHVSLEAKRAAASGETVVGPLVVPSYAETSLVFLKFIYQENHF